jgi:hypothetical protein
MFGATGFQHHECVLLVSFAWRCDRAAAQGESVGSQRRASWRRGEYHRFSRTRRSAALWFASMAFVLVDRLGRIAVQQGPLEMPRSTTVPRVCRTGEI